MNENDEPMFPENDHDFPSPPDPLDEVAVVCKQLIQMSPEIVELLSAEFQALQSTVEVINLLDNQNEIPELVLQVCTLSKARMLRWAAARNAGFDVFGEEEA